MEVTARVWVVMEVTDTVSVAMEAMDMVSEAMEDMEKALVVDMEVSAVATERVLEATVDMVVMV